MRVLKHFLRLNRTGKEETVFSLLVIGNASPRVKVRSFQIGSERGGEGNMFIDAFTLVIRFIFTQIGGRERERERERKRERVYLLRI